MQIGGIHSSMTSLGRVSVKLSGVVRGTAEGRDASAINAPKIGDARAELDRVARVTGADKVMNVVSDYRRTALAGGPMTTQWRVEVQAWGTAMAVVEPAPAEDVDADKQEAARKAEAERQEQQKKAADKPAEEDDASTSTLGPDAATPQVLPEARVAPAAGTAPTSDPVAQPAMAPTALAPPATSAVLAAPSVADDSVIHDTAG